METVQGNLLLSFFQYAREFDLSLIVNKANIWQPNYTITIVR